MHENHEIILSKNENNETQKTYAPTKVRTRDGSDNTDPNPYTDPRPCALTDPQAKKTLRSDCGPVALGVQLVTCGGRVASVEISHTAFVWLSTTFNLSA